MPVTPDFSERLRKITLRNRRKTHKPGQTWPIEKRVEVVSQWLVVGNMKQVAAISGVPYDLVRKWKGQPWWADLEREIRATQNIELDGKLSKIVDKSLEAVLDRVEHGDFIYDQKTGEVRRKPAALRDLHRVAVDTISKRELIRTEEKTDQAKISVEDHLKMIAQELVKLSKGPEKPVIDLVEVEDALYEEREAGLQEGAEMGAREEAESGGGSCGTEQGPEDDDGRREGSER
jgi:hypothetical protein